MSRYDHTPRSGADRANLYDEITDKIIAELEAGRFPWVQPWGKATAQAPLGLPQNASTGRAYSGINILILWGAVVQHGFPASCQRRSTTPASIREPWSDRLFVNQPTRGRLTRACRPRGFGRAERARVIADPVGHFGRLSRGGWSPASQDRSRNPCPMQMPPPSPPASPPR